MASPLPSALRPLFWNQVFRRLSWAADRDLITARILERGDWDAVCWLWRRLGDDGLRDWLVARRGAGLSPRKLRYWELVLKIPRRKVNAWLRDPGRQVWDNRCNVWDNRCKKHTRRRARTTAAISEA